MNICKKHNVYLPVNQGYCSFCSKERKMRGGLNEKKEKVKASRE